MTAASYGRTGVGDQFHFHPEAYLELARSEVPACDGLQDVVAQNDQGSGRTVDSGPGCGNGCHVAAGAGWAPKRTTGVDESAAMLDHAR